MKHIFRYNRTRQTRLVNKLFDDWLAWQHVMRIFRSSWNCSTEVEDAIEANIVHFLPNASPNLHISHQLAWIFVCSHCNGFVCNLFALKIHFAFGVHTPLEHCFVAAMQWSVFRDLLCCCLGVLTWIVARSLLYHFLGVLHVFRALQCSCSGVAMHLLRCSNSV